MAANIFLMAIFVRISGVLSSGWSCSGPRNPDRKLELPGSPLRSMSRTAARRAEQRRPEDCGLESVCGHHDPSLRADEPGRRNPGLFGDDGACRPAEDPRLLLLFCERAALFAVAVGVVDCALRATIKRIMHRARMRRRPTSLLLPMLIFFFRHRLLRLATKESASEAC